MNKLGKYHILTSFTHFYYSTQLQISFWNLLPFNLITLLLCPAVGRGMQSGDTMSITSASAGWEWLPWLFHLRPVSPWKLASLPLLPTARSRKLTFQLLISPMSNHRLASHLYYSPDPSMRGSPREHFHPLKMSHCGWGRDHLGNQQGCLQGGRKALSTPVWAFMKPAVGKGRNGFQRFCRE